LRDTDKSSRTKRWRSAQRHAGEDAAILAIRHQNYLKAREQNPARWSGNTRDWTPVGPVTITLNATASSSKT